MTADTTDRILQLIGAGRFDEAEQHCLLGRDCSGDHEYTYFLAIIRAQQKRFDEAIRFFEDAARALPERADIAFNFGVVCQTAGDTEKAVEQWQRAAAIDPVHQDALYNAALGCDRLGRTDEAERTYERLLEIDPEHLNGLYNLANLDVRLGKNEDALAHFRRLLDLKPDFEAAWINRAIAAQRTGDLAEAERCFRQALSLNPESAEAHWNLSHLLLIQGRRREGFAEYEWRLERPEAPRPDWPQPAWDGTAAPDKRLLLWVDQGVGDAIQFLRYARFAAERVGEVFIQCQDSLVRLAKTAPGIERAVALGEAVPDFDCHAPLMSLAHLLSMPEPAESWHGPYLSAAQDFALESAAPGKRIGLVWAGNPAHRNDANRSCPVAALLPLLDLPDCAFYSLQVEPGADARQTMTASGAITDLTPRLEDFADTAAAVQALDLVISVDTAVAHLAGALGKPAFVMLPATDPDWRWLREGDETAWYPSLRLFRQASPGDWAGVIADITHALKKI
ncbi:MAG: tetratricopeptide repeat-containing glycosyltransferase family protein [Rhodospirillales bacterium]